MYLINEVQPPIETIPQTEASLWDHHNGPVERATEADRAPLSKAQRDAEKARQRVEQARQELIRPADPA
jgi:hypothetical protein